MNLPLCGCGTSGVPPGVAADVHLVDHALVAAAIRVEVAFPVEFVIDYLGAGHAARAVAPVARQVLLLVADGVAELGVGPVDRADDRLRVRVEQQLVGIEAVSLVGRVGPVRAIGVELPGAKPRNIPVPHEVGALAQHEALRLALAAVVEEAQLHLLGVARVDREVDALVVEGGAEREGRSRPELERRVGRGFYHVVVSSRRPRNGISIQSGRLAIS